jgi:hypothetical protein
MVGLLTDFLGIRGINFNLKQFFFEFDTMKATGTSYEKKEMKKISDMINTAMESDNNLDKDEDITMESNENSERDEDIAMESNENSERDESLERESKPLDKGKGVDKDESMSLDQEKEVKRPTTPPWKIV